MSFPSIDLYGFTAIGRIERSVRSIFSILQCNWYLIQLSEVILSEVILKIVMIMYTYLPTYFYFLQIALQPELIKGIL